jgi:hypothetical protein
LLSPRTTPSGRISNELERREKEKNNVIYSGQLSLCQQQRAAHALRSDQLIPDGLFASKFPNLVVVVGGVVQGPSRANFGKRKMEGQPREPACKKMK